MGAELVVRVGEVIKTYRPRHAAPVPALRGVSLQVERGEALGIMGASGSGKSTLLSVIGTLEPADSGSVVVLEQEVTRLSRAQTAHLRFGHIGFVFQQYHLLPGLTVLENLLARYVGRPRPTAVREKALELLERVGLGGRAGALPRELSGGEQQRVCIARALLGEPDLILADEPTGSLDSENGRAVVGLMLDLVRARGATLVLVTHNPGVAGRMDRVVEMRDGSLTVGGLPPDSGGFPGAATDSHPRVGNGSGR